MRSGSPTQCCSPPAHPQKSCVETRSGSPAPHGRTRTNSSPELPVYPPASRCSASSDTAGLDWTVDPETSDNITVSPIKGSGSGTLTFMASANTGIERTGAFTISVLGVNPARTTKVVAMQMAGETGAYIGDLQICKTDNSGGAKNWSGANFYCSDLTAEGKSDWRLPSMDELLIIAKNRDSLNSIDGFTDLSTQWHWSGTSGGNGYHWVVLLGNGDIYNIQDYYADRYLVRCVRDK